MIPVQRATPGVWISKMDGSPDSEPLNCDSQETAGNSRDCSAAWPPERRAPITSTLPVLSIIQRWENLEIRLDKGPMQSLTRGARGEHGPEMH